ncbi:hypothetical protein [Nocardioides convexus]|uniref:hypothetical protein n=1 Tax=Nocardioides convexus TaxID=2712224 RepID=UPI002418408E|nr:hypothetical protein [Nocardioides convexus]
MPGRGAIAAMTGRTLGLVGETRRGPAALRLAAHRHVRRDAAGPAPGAQPAGPGPRRPGGAGGRLRRPVQGAGHRAVDAGRHGRAAARRQSRWPTTAPAATLPRRSPSRSPTTSRTCAGGCPAPPSLVLQVDEPALPAVLAAAVPTASGFGRHRTIHPPEASEALEAVLGAAAAAGATPWVHCCAPDVPIGLLRGAGARGVMLDLDLLGPAGMDAAAEALEAGETLAMGVVPTSGEPAHRQDRRGAGAALARPPRPRPGHGGGARRDHPGLRSRRVRRRPPHHRAGALGRALAGLTDCRRCRWVTDGSPTTRSLCHARPERQGRRHHRR